MLGFVGALKAPVGAHFGKGSGDIFLDEVQCNGTEIDLEHCDHDGIGVHNCAHNEDASVECIQPDTANKIAIVYGLCITFPSFFVVITLTYCLRTVRTKRAGRYLENEIYLDLQDIGINKGTMAPSTYQDLNAPPNLPERPLTTFRQSTTRSSGQRFHNHDERILTEKDREHGSHDYTEMGTTNKTVSADKDEHSYAYNIHLENSAKDNGPQDHITSMTSTRRQEDARERISHGQSNGQNKAQGYKVMNTVYKKIDVGKDEDIDGYLLPSKTNETAKSPIRAEHAKATMPADNDKISVSSRTDYSEDENARLQKEVQNTELSAHEFLDVTTFGQGISKENKIDSDGYLLPVASGVSHEMND
ncbi:uncharacterized protein LOC121424151 [Lytechinus variegatus]|uniref:uncharacterized protein LOC121424151 n=1 Tax=Lytechinus variegatus TaxID=7654 RepID=UPI001BB16BD3|nr:uncharacterized protein LOC121424151 [Lytechinus variegatus]